MRRIKYVLPLLLLALAFVLAACGGSQPSVPVAAADTATEPLNLPADVDVQTVASVADRDDVYLLDVREQWEYDEGHIPGVNLLPMGEVPGRLSEIPKDKTVIVTCRTGNRSAQVTQFLRQNGFDNVHNMAGGLVGWQAAGYEVVR